MRKVIYLFTCFGKCRLTIWLIAFFILPPGIIKADNLAINEFQQVKQITGTVTEAATGNTLPGVSISIKGTTQGTITDMEGNYSIEASNDDVLVFSFVGYLTDEVLVGDQSVVNMSMIVDVIGLGEIVVTGYGVQKKSDLTGSIASVKGDDLAKLPSGSFDEALKGRAAGVFSASESGAPGSAPVIRIRGNSSINGGDPLIIVDGVPSSIWAVNSINSSDIASVEVLKDASSQAIYGASGGNGVILITTKKGDRDRITTNLDYFYGYQVPRKNMDLLGTKEFFEVYNELDVPEALRLDWNEDSIASAPNTSWYDELTRNAPMQSVNLAISGGNEKSTFRFSTAYFTHMGTIPNSDYERFNVRINSDHKITKRIKVGQNLAISRDVVSGLERWNFNGQYHSPIYFSMMMHPFVEPYAEGAEPLTYAWGRSPINAGLENPFVRIDRINREVPTYRMNGDINVSVEFIDGLVFKSIAGYGTDFGFAKEFFPEYYYSPTVQNTVESFDRMTWRNYNWYLQNTLTYNFDVGEHDFSFMAGYESGYYLNEGFKATGIGLLSEAETMHYFNSVTGSVLVEDYNEIRDVATDAFFGRINYNYKGKYLFTSNIRRDRSSKFGPRNRAGVFPSLSAGWKFTEENFMDNLPWISFGKIRAGWGRIGNSNIGVYKYYAQVRTADVYNTSLDNLTAITGVAPHGIANYELQWEAMKSTNVGIDLTFLQNMLSLSVDYFQKSNDGMLIEKPTPHLAGTFQQNEGAEGGSTSYTANLGEVYSKGFEVTAGYKASTGDFQHNFNINFSHSVNEVGDIGGDTLLNGSVLGSRPSFTAEGHPMGSFYGLQTDGLFQESDGVLQNDGTWLITNQPYSDDGEGNIVYAQPNAQPGDVRFVDANKDGVINSDDRVIIGNPHPKYLLGFSYDLSYKMFDFSMFWQGAFGHDIIQATKYNLYNNSGMYNWEAGILDRWSPENTGAELFRISYYDRNDNDRFSDFYVEKGSYLRLKNIQVGCTVPENIVSRLNIRSLRIYVSVKDIITITKYPGVDPEIAVNRDPLEAGIDYSAYPRPIVYTGGINVTF
jgi:TonB-linked SusC/RagA family outer membrane protein